LHHKCGLFGNNELALDQFAAKEAEAEDLEKISVKPKRMDIALEIFGLAWMPFKKNAGGGLSPDRG
jgi:hypothetical protein